MGGPGPLCRALIGLCVLVIGAGGLRTISQEEEEDCSQTGVGCTIKHSSCFDFHWLRTFTWTPNGPSQLEVAAGIGQNDLGRVVPLLNISWTVAIDASIRELQGVEVSILESFTNQERCVQFQFNESFPAQLNENNKPWQFSYNKFEVNPGQEYHVTVYHLPKKEGVNFKRQRLIVPGCNEGRMMETNTCCDRGLCWFPNIELSHQGENLTVEFSTRWDAQKYGVRVKIKDVPIDVSNEIFLEQGPPIQRMRVTFPNIGGYTDKECVYNISVWPYMPPCNNDCIRQYYVPACSTEAPPPPGPAPRLYLWAVAILLTIALCGGVIMMLCCSGNDLIDKPKPPPFVKPVSKTVWLIYSAEHKYYRKLVIKLADFMRSALGLDVVLDLYHSNKMSVIGPMSWLDRQKDQIKKKNGTILILCSRGVQEKWKAMQNVDEQRTLLADRKHTTEDLLTPALKLVLSDFQKSLPYDGYVVAYFSNISSQADIPSVLEICPKYSLPKNLREVFFRIQRLEQRQPNTDTTFSYEEHFSYKRLVKAIERCREWQEKNPCWIENEQVSDEDSEDTEGEEEWADNPAGKVIPQISFPETPFLMVEPVILESDPVSILDPTIMIGALINQIEPYLPDIDFSTSVLVEPFLQEPPLLEAGIQEPRLIGEEPSFGVLPSCALRQDVSIQSDHADHGAISLDLLREAQERFWQHSIENSDLTSAMDFMGSSVQDLGVPLLSDRVGEQSCEINLEGPLMTPAVNPVTGLSSRHSSPLTDRGYSTWNTYEMDLNAIRMESLKLFLQNEGGSLNYEQNQIFRRQQSPADAISPSGE